MVEKNQASIEEYIASLIKKAPPRLRDVTVETRRDLDLGSFLILGNLFMKDEGVIKLYLTSHTPNHTKKTSYRLWLDAPHINGHPDWDWNLGLAETWLSERNSSSDLYIYSQISEKGLEFHDMFVNTYPQHHFCEETRTYRLKEDSDADDLYVPHPRIPGMMVRRKGAPRSAFAVMSDYAVDNIFKG